ncbi:hypothetical protein M422DRAFT_255136 [Sphaerobolus stellatus SS14]|uniref:Uncharacterized protein n=1 Tax=Sphaerobolus stellatus (strain SS14) TaxID=990650 RepID=A0A0C9VJM6_SPHS4|nr:hypothetical protein M422DRAFT_255136 [Sphaerobolus stellatus SS14]
MANMWLSFVATSHKRFLSLSYVSRRRTRSRALVPKEWQLIALKHPALHARYGILSLPLVKYLASPTSPFPMHILLQMDAPHKVPSNGQVNPDGLRRHVRIQISHTGMIPWTVDWVARLAEQVRLEEGAWGDV